jgi:GNAT superfamily N-acetyltransferase
MSWTAGDTSRSRNTKPGPTRSAPSKLYEISRALGVPVAVLFARLNLDHRAPVVELSETASSDDFTEPELRARTIESPRARHTRHYAVREGGREVAFVALDLIPRVEFLVLYELYVPRGLRNRGIGSRMLDAVERLAKERGYKRPFRISMEAIQQAG